MSLNPNPIVFSPGQASPSLEEHLLSQGEHLWDEEHVDPYTPTEIYDLIRSINDPEHPLTLEQLNVVRLEHISITPLISNMAQVLPEVDLRRQLRIRVDFTPTIPHCSMATLIGLCIKVKLLKSLPRTALIDVRVRIGTHQNETAINKQLADKERVAAALDNDRLADVVKQCIYGPTRAGIAL